MRKHFATALAAFLFATKAAALPAIRYNNLIVPGTINVIDVPADGECLAFDAATNLFEWVACGSGSGDSIEVEDGDNDGTFSAVDTTGRFEDQDDINFVLTGGAPGGPDTITALLRADVVGVTELDDGADTAAIDNVVMIDNADTTAFIYIAVPDCDNATTSKLLYDVTGQAFSCGTDQDTGGGSSEWTDVGTFLHPNETTDDVVIGAATVALGDIFLGDDGSAVFNEQGAAVDFRIETDGNALAFHVDSAAEEVIVNLDFRAESQIIFDSSAIIRLFTSDASDNQNIQLCPAGTCGASRGGQLTLAGNEQAATGNVDLQAGAVSGADIILETNFDDGQIQLLTNLSGTDNDFIIDNTGFGFTGQAGDDVSIGAGLNVRFNGTTSGVVDLGVAAAAGTWAMTLPTGGGTVDFMLRTDGAGVTSWVNPSTLEINDLEAVVANVADTEIFVGDGAASGTYVLVSGDATLANTGALTVTGLTCTNCVNATQVADIYLFNTGDTATGDYTFDTTTFFIDSTLNNVGIGTITPTHTLEIIGHALIDHTADETSDHVLELQADALGFGAMTALLIQYVTGTISAGEDQDVILINIDESDSTGGDVIGLEVLSTAAGSATVYAMLAGAQVNPVIQLAGTFGNVGFCEETSDDIAFVDCVTAFSSTGTDITIWDADDDRIYLGESTVFGQVTWLFDSFATNPGIKPIFEYWNGSAWTAFSPGDGTDGARSNGVMSWIPSELTGWATTSVDGDTAFWIRITRTANSITSPIEDLVQNAATIAYTWDLNGNITANSFRIEGSDDDFETILTSTDPTADRTATFPDLSGEVSLLGQTPDSILIDGVAVTDGSGVDFIGGTNGIDIAFNPGASPDEATFNFDATEVDSVTWGTGTGDTWTLAASTTTQFDIITSSIDSSVCITAGTAACTTGASTGSYLDLDGDDLGTATLLADGSLTMGGGGDTLILNVTNLQYQGPIFRLSENNAVIEYEGASDGFELTLAFADPGSDVTVTVPAITGTLVTTGDTGTVDATMIADDAVGVPELDDGADTASSDDVVMIDNADNTQFIYIAVPDCDNATTSKLLYDVTTQAFSCGTDQDSGGATAIDNLADVGAGDDAVGLAEQGQVWTWDSAASAAAYNGLTLAIEHDSTTDGNTQVVLVVQRNETAGDEVVETLILVTNLDTGLAVTTGIEVSSAAGTMTTGIDLSDADLVNAANMGENFVLFVPTTGTIWSLFAEDTADDLQLNVNTGSTETFDITNIGAGVIDLNVDGVVDQARVSIDGTTCLDVSSDQIFHDTDCDGTKDGGEEFIDQTGGGSVPDDVLNFAVAGLFPTDTSDGFCPNDTLTATTVETIVAACDASSQEWRNGVFQVPSALSSTGSDTVTFRLKVVAATAASANVAASFDHCAVANDEDLDSCTFVGEDSGTVAVSTTQNDEFAIEWTETITNLGWLPEETVYFKIGRELTGDTLSGDLFLVHFQISIPQE